jgi:hypothetical protein
VQSWTRKPAGGWSRGKDCVLPFETPPTLTNIQHFLTLTASERLTYVLKLANLGLDTKASVALVKNTKVENNTPETEALLDELAEEIRNIAEGVEGTGEGAMGFLERVVKELDTRVSDSGKDVKRLTAAAAGFIQAAERRAENPVRPDIEDIVAERRKTVNELKEKQRAQIREHKASTDRDKQRAKWQETIDATKSAPAEVAELEQKLADKRTEIGRLELELEGLEGKWAEWTRANDESDKPRAAPQDTRRGRGEMEAEPRDREGDREAGADRGGAGVKQAPETGRGMARERAHDNAVERGHHEAPEQHRGAEAGDLPALPEGTRESSGERAPRATPRETTRTASGGRLAFRERTTVGAHHGTHQ